jgi:hypothetical protein
VIERDHTNSFFALAAEFINNTSRSVFLTGKAGTGKTTFLKYICENTSKNFVVAAPTGVAAINAGGMTLHSLFQLPFGIYLPGYHSNESSVPVTNRNTLFKNLRLSNSKRDLLQELELLIIDEVSMVRCDMLDAVDAILRVVRKSQKPFGGVQVLFIGDLFQLSPVAGTEEWSLLKGHYESPFFFHSLAVQQAPPLCIELTKIYRQKEQLFIDLLNNIRNNELTQADFELLNSRKINIDSTDGFITLTTHNSKADLINEQELNKLGGNAFRFTASIENDFPDRNYPTDPILVLKVGARIMFIKNDSSEEKRYYNGKIATVTDINEETIAVQFETGELFELTKETWRNIRYTYNTEKDEIEEEELGAFTQYPIRLAWAITIHKSQGLTFQRAIIDAGSSFASGQVYVALSRCTSLQGLILQSSITHRQIVTDPIVAAYSRQLKNELQLQDELQKEKEEFEKEYFIKLFSFNKLQQAIFDWSEDVPKKKLPNLQEAIALTKELKDKSIELVSVAEKTQQWIEKNFMEARATTNYDKLSDGLQRSVAHFNLRLHDQLFLKLQNHYKSLKSKSKVKKYLKQVRELADVISWKAKKIRKASWNGQVLFRGDEMFTKPEELRKDHAQPNVSSAEETFVLFQREHDVHKIAGMRGLAVSTIEGHLLEFVKSGELQIEKLVSPEKIKVIQEAISKTDSKKSSEIKKVLGDDFTYAEIRAVLYQIK